VSGQDDQKQAAEAEAESALWGRVRRRTLLRRALGVGAAAALAPVAAACGGGEPFTRVRPGDPDWPGEEQWARLRERVGGNLVEVESPLAPCVSRAGSPACEGRVEEMTNPFFVHEQAGALQASGWLDAWEDAPSVWAVEAESAADVAAAVDFAREHRLRLAVKGGGHSYFGNSGAPDSLLIWTTKMDRVELDDGFVPNGAPAGTDATPAAMVGAGAIWLQVYGRVMVEEGRYVQGGGCNTVGVAGLVQSGGYGSFSKRFGSVAGNLLQAEVVTADGGVLTVNEHRHPDLFWALKGGGGGSWGIVTRVWLRLHELPRTLGIVFATVKAGSDAAYCALIARFVEFYAAELFDERWGEVIRVAPDNTLTLGMTFADLGQAEAERIWRPFFEWVRERPGDYSFEQEPTISARPGQRFWDLDYLLRVSPEMVTLDERPGAPAGNWWWTGDGDQASRFMYGYDSGWLPASLLSGAGQRRRLVAALFAASRHNGVILQPNKGLAGAPEEARAAARDTATNPAALDAFALAIVATGSGPGTFPAVPGHEPDPAEARQGARGVGRAMEELRPLTGPGSYLSESNYFERNWQEAYWGTEHFERLARVKRRYDPDGLFFTHNGIGSEEWTDDGFRRRG